MFCGKPPRRGATNPRLRPRLQSATDGLKRRRTFKSWCCCLTEKILLNPAAANAAIYAQMRECVCVFLSLSRSLPRNLGDADSLCLECVWLVRQHAVEGGV